MGIDYRNADDYKNGSRHDRKNRPHDAETNENRPNSNNGDVLDWILSLSDSKLCVPAPHSPDNLGLHVCVVSSEVSIEGEVTEGYPDGRVF